MENHRWDIFPVLSRPLGQPILSYRGSVKTDRFSKPDDSTRVIAKSQEVIYRVGRQLVQEKKKELTEGNDEGRGKDLLSLLRA